MVSKSVRKWIALGLVGALAPIAGALSQEAQGQEGAPPVPQYPVPLEVTLRAPSEAEDVIALIADGVQAIAAAVDETAADEAPTSEYYIGIALGELPAVAKTQLKLEHGVVIDEVLPDSPAAKAEFKPQDILIRVGEAKVEQPADIVKAVEEAKD